MANRSKSGSSRSNQGGSSQSGRSTGNQTMADVGRKGGLAPHECRGFECQKESKSSNRSGSSKSSRNK